MSDWNAAIDAAAEKAADAIPTANPPRTDGYSNHVAGERLAAENIRTAILALRRPDPPAAGSSS